MDSISDQIQSILYLGDPSKALPNLRASFAQFNLDQSKDLLKFLKATIKSRKNPPTVKLQALKILRNSMKSKNPHIVSYCGQKFYDRFKIFCEFRKESNDERRGKTLFNAETKLEQTASEEFLVLLLTCVKDWNECFGKDLRGKATPFCKLYTHLVSKNVAFPLKQYKKDLNLLRQQLLAIKKSSRLIIDLIAEDADHEKIKKIGKSLKSSNRIITNEIEKYMEMEDHSLIQDLNHSLDLLSNAQSSYDSWKSRLNISSFLQSPCYILPQTCLFLTDVAPKEHPFTEELSISLQNIEFDESSPELIITDRDLEIDKDFGITSELTGLGADYCILKDKYEMAEQNAISLKYQLEVLNEKYLVEVDEKENLEFMIETLSENERKITEELTEKIEKLTIENVEYRNKSETLTESLRESEKKLEICIENLRVKSEKVESLETSNSALMNSCKSLELEVEKYTESEKYLRKEIKELFKRIGKRRPKRESSSISSNSELIHANSPTKDFKVMLMDQPIQDKETSNSMIFDSLETEQTMRQETPEMINENDFIPARTSKERFSYVDNIVFFRDCMRKKRGVLYEDPVVKVWISTKVTENSGKIELSIENKSQSQLANMKTKLFSDPLERISLAISKEAAEVLEKEARTYRQILFQCMDLFQVFPMLQLTYTIEGEKHCNILLLPIAYTLFCNKPKIDFVKEWESIDEYRETLGNTSLENIKSIAKNLLFNKNFEYSYTEGNGVIIATGSPIGLVLALVVLKEGKVSIQVKATDVLLRDVIHSLIVAQLFTER